NALRNLVRFGDSIVASPRYPSATSAVHRGLLLGEPLVHRHRVMAHDVALVDPGLDAAGTVGGARHGRAVVHVTAQRVQRHPALAIGLRPRDLGAAEAARALDADA